ncbi:class I SAM-dependent methyltransferase [Rhizomonospora bruguierae]|uniref:class I SAM-dependent methyltransferase n=1 Tax=Rhizomonospora bruguierae TaxID=1581705 RepID=UPI001BCB1105|nr:class I SAM-dependent methyltransferase [Micromonospora sp. NBRC 107566]
MSPYTTALVEEPHAWQESWDRQQEAYLPDREERFAALLDAVAAVTDGRSPRVLDLAGGTGSISLRLRRRFPGAKSTLVDLDPVLLAIARSSLGPGGVVAADLRKPEWVKALPNRDYDAVLTATALHWLEPERLTRLYAELRGVLRVGGVLVNVDHMPDRGLPTLTSRLTERARHRRDARHAAGAVLSWREWWRHVAADPTLGPLMAEREKVFGGNHAAETAEPVDWHIAALREAGFAEAGVLWRGGADAAIAALR